MSMSAADLAGDWIAERDADGRLYYWNTTTRKVVWEADAPPIIQRQAERLAVSAIQHCTQVKCSEVQCSGRPVSKCSRLVCSTAAVAACLSALTRMSLCLCSIVSRVMVVCAYCGLHVCRRCTSGAHFLHFIPKFPWIDTSNSSFYITKCIIIDRQAAEAAHQACRRAVEAEGEIANEMIRWKGRKGIVQQLLTLDQVSE